MIHQRRSPGVQEGLLRCDSPEKVPGGARGAVEV